MTVRGEVEDYERKKNQKTRNRIGEWRGRGGVHDRIDPGRNLQETTLQRRAMIEDDNDNDV